MDEKMKYSETLNYTGTEEMSTGDKETGCYSVMDLCRILGISRPTCYSLLKKREFSWINIGGRKYRISRKSFDNWLNNQNL